MREDRDPIDRLKEQLRREILALIANIERRVEITVVGHGRPRIFHFPPRKVDNSRFQRRRDVS
jgi:hypothetical protein